ncbi:hypothetical protein VPH35_036663 [Triticum aestivum]
MACGARRPGRRLRTFSLVMVAVVATWVAPRLELGGIGTPRQCVGPPSCQGCLALAGGLARAVARGARSVQTWPFLAPVVVMGSLAGGSAWCRWRRRAVLIGGFGLWWRFRQAVALMCRFEGRASFASRGESHALALAGANNGDACGCRAPSWRCRHSRAYGLFSRTPEETLVPGSWSGRWRRFRVAVLLRGIVL